MSLADELQDVLAQLWTSLGLEPFELEADRAKVGGGKTACVWFGGDFQGAALLQVTDALALRIAQRLFGSEPAELGPVQVTDALGEVLHIAAGNLRHLVAGAAQVSLPVVAEGEDHHLLFPGGQVLAGLWFRLAGEPAQLLLIEAEARTWRTLPRELAGFVPGGGDDPG